MAKHRLLNCEFVCASSFKVNVSNKGKLLYLTMFVSADDMGFVDTTNDIINSLEKNDSNFRNEVNIELLDNDYKSALKEILEKGLLYEFKDNHCNKVHLIRHWFYHNKWKKGLWTNYRNFLDQVHLENNEYIFGKKPLKENKENNINQDKLNQNMVSSEQNENEEQVEELINYFGKKEEEE